MNQFSCFRDIIARYAIFDKYILDFKNHSDLYSQLFSNSEDCTRYVEFTSFKIEGLMMFWDDNFKDELVSLMRDNIPTPYKASIERVVAHLNNKSKESIIDDYRSHLYYGSFDDDFLEGLFYGANAYDNRDYRDFLYRNLLINVLGLESENYDSCNLVTFDDIFNSTCNINYLLAIHTDSANRIKDLSRDVNLIRTFASTLCFD